MNAAAVAAREFPMPPLSFQEARALVARNSRQASGQLPVESVPLDSAAGRVLARDICADRDYPPFNRSARDGFAVIASDVASVPARLELIGETRAGEPSRFALEAGQTVEIMTGAPGPQNADAVVMVEHSERHGTAVTLNDSVRAGRNLIMAGSEARRGQCVLQAGTRIEYPGVALLGTVGCSDVPVYRRPDVAILSTGDEVLPVSARPHSYQIRNSNAHSLAAQVRRRGGAPRILPVAKDTLSDTRQRIEEGLASDILLLSGGVSMGKHDLVKEVLADLGGELLFTSVRIQPGKPLVFARCGQTLVFGLPGNPLSTMVTFEVFAAIAVELAGGAAESPLRFQQLPLAQDFRHKPVLTRFLGARLEGQCGETRVRVERGQGSGDVAAFARAECLVVASEQRAEWRAGDAISVMPL
ncbi:MAG: molybdopterin molybdotransferase MoeA [Bryobacterales bacterium]|nr:molybdopterin molybdotransferase MoeA [Bryobacterales bacterium]